MTKNHLTHTLSREHSLLAFNQRVLNLAKRDDYPLLERVKFLAIVSSNLDEFFEIRANELNSINNNNASNSNINENNNHSHSLIQMVHDLVEQQYKLFDEVLRPELQKNDIIFLSSQCLKSNDNQQKKGKQSPYQWAKEYFEHHVLPILTPIALDPAHPFPNILNKSLNFIVELSGEDVFGRQAHIAIVQVPRSLPRVITVPKEISGVKHGFVMLSTLIKTFMSQLFEGLELLHCYQFRITRDADLSVDEEIEDLRLALTKELPFRPFGKAVRLEIYKDCPQYLVEFLQKEYELHESQTFKVAGWVNLVRIMQMVEMIDDEPQLKFPIFTAKNLPELYYENPFDYIKQQDVLLHHPYESFLPVLHLLQFAAADPQVVAIKQTIYRTGMDSQLMEALLLAAKNGKEVTVVLELMARFDEATNIHWSSQLEAVGVHVVYGVVGHKTHAKMLMIIRQENNEISKSAEFKRYVHLGTGNYHQKTAKLYTDFGLMTVNSCITEQIHHVFLQLTGLVGLLKSKKLDENVTPAMTLWQSPFNLRERFLTHVDEEIKQVQEGKKALIFVKVNALLDNISIEKLKYAANQGVQVYLIVRGACLLAPQKNLHIKSIVGRFLEHSRIYYFYNQGSHDLFLSSADLMPRNLDRRVEIAFPILDSLVKKRVLLEGFVLPWFDVVNSTNYHYYDAVQKNNEQNEQQNDQQMNHQITQQNLLAFFPEFDAIISNRETSITEKTLTKSTTSKILKSNKKQKKIEKIDALNNLHTFNVHDFLLAQEV